MSAKLPTHNSKREFLSVEILAGTTNSVGHHLDSGFFGLAVTGRELFSLGDTKVKELIGLQKIKLNLENSNGALVRHHLTGTECHSSKEFCS